ncbi:MULTISPECIES: MalY/PatB family protein [Pseudomonas]|uniref:MalY/PatB family protein n=1 Tax=Pseudomonas TaxID=286 RepID=UPI000BA43B3F|nr:MULTISPECIES: aminotransferase class I/II-fold pyridoxal phosphate-dependent enzyme [Pseudomonas]MDR9862706.1 aminotransferase class I/II-fold pyridoxal phosphate-dependent enzyme [Pseudomonas baetica]
MTSLRAANRLASNTLALARYPDTQPHWVADMAFATPEPILSAISKRVMEGHFSYPHAPESLYGSIQSWCKTRYAWDVDRDWIVIVPNTISGVRNAVKCLYDYGSIFTQRPNYHKLLDIGKSFDVEAIEIDTQLSQKPFTVSDLQKISLENPCAVVLCNPANPAGTVSSRADLETLADCIKDLRTTIVSDEAHADLILSGQKHVPAGSVRGLQDRSITLLSPSKTFNLAGISVAYAVIPSRKIRDQFISSQALYCTGINALGLVALEQAYHHCSAWLESLLTQLRKNQRMMYDCLLQTSLKYVPAEATYLAWIDTSAAGNNVYDKLLHKGIAVSDGKEFGAPGWIRFNFAHPESQLSYATDTFLDLFGNKT